MFYYHVWVRSNRYHGSEPLTYAYRERLKVGAVVEVELQRESVLGLVSHLTTKPKFKTKEIKRALDLPPLPAHWLKLTSWLAGYYPAPLGLITQQFLPASFSAKQLETSSNLTLTPPALSNLPPLTNEQAAALEQMEPVNNYLLHGKTGSGKTRLYIELAARSVERGHSAIILTPEISLTSQLADSFRRVFKERVLVIHSKQTASERQRAWLDALNSTEPLIAVGPRSALFVPLRSLGLIVLDEAHESAYKQEQAPQYQAARVAAYLAGLTRASLVLGSATPLVTDYFLAEQKRRPIIKLTKLAQASSHPPTEVLMIDRKEHSLFNRSAFVSQPLIEALEKTLANEEQSLLYLNRRGTARLVLCENCGWQATCPNCDLPLTYHGDKHQMRCHSCNYYAMAPSSCPSCHSPSVVFKTAGTKAIEAEIKRLFPNARVARFDTDNLKAERFEQNYTQALEGQIDILIGTQLLAKGLDLPRLTLVGILLADTSLYIPDFTAQERTFQLINQVLGRIGRGHSAGRAIIQTYHPDHPILKLAVTSDYDSFYALELASRQQFLFPPFCYLLKLTLRRASLKGAETAAEELKSELMGSYKVRIEGPAPSFYERQAGKYQWQLVVKAVERSELVKIIAALPANVAYDIDPVDLL